VEAPVKNVTDELAQSSQFDLGDFGGNASDNLADPVLDAVDGNAGTWAPDKAKESSTRLASGVEAIRCAEAHIAAMPNTYKMDDRWKLTARFETMRQAVVRDRTRLCEQMIQDQRIAARRTARTVSAGASRGTNGLPQGLGRRTAAAGSRREASVASPDSDSLMFF